MSDEMKKLAQPVGLVGSKIKLNPSGGRPLTVQERLAEAKKAYDRAININPMRSMIKEGDPVVLILDCSSSMDCASGHNDNTPRIDHLKTALKAFANEVNFAATPVSALSFPDGYTEIMRSQQNLNTYTNNLEANGSTPLANAMQEASQGARPKRAIIISDGQPDNEEKTLEEARNYRSRDIVADCIHIGVGGEEFLKQVAEITGGMFFKFTDLKSFSDTFKYLAPKNRGVLSQKSEEEIKRLTGASEVIK